MRQVDASTFTTMKKLFVKAVLLVITSLAAVACTSCNKGNEAVAPVVGSTIASEITATSAKITVTIVSDGGTPITKQGVVNGLSTYVSDAFNSKTFSTSIGDLSPNTVYIIRGFATNSVGTGYSDVQFTTSDLPIVKGHDGTTYHVVTAFGETITLENFKGRTFNNNDPIPVVPDNAAWTALKTPGMCDLNNDPANANIYGSYYNFYAVNDPRGIAPDGYHVPTQLEWQNYGEAIGLTGAGAIKQTGNSTWSTPNTGATNSSGVTAIGSGYRLPSGVFEDQTKTSSWWSSTGLGNMGAYNAYCTYNSARFMPVTTFDYGYGMTIRFFKNK